VFGKKQIIKLTQTNIETKEIVAVAAIANSFFHLDSTTIKKSKEFLLDLMLFLPIVPISPQLIHLKKR
jgi:hypothetical protein